MMKPCKIKRPEVKQMKVRLDPNDKMPRAFSMFFTMQGNREIQQEYLVYEPLDFIGTVGGTLGLFVGFSFYDFIAMIIDQLFDNFQID